MRFAQIKVKQQAVGHIGFKEDPSLSSICCYISPLEVAFRQFTIHFIHLDHQELELWPRSVASHFYGLIQIIIFAFLSFRKIGSLVLVEALA